MNSGPYIDIDKLPHCPSLEFYFYLNNTKRISKM